MTRAKVWRRGRDGMWRVMFSHIGGHVWTGLRAYPTHAEALRAAIEAVGLSPCTCDLLPERFHTTHYGMTEPGSMYDWDPDCPQHQLKAVGLTPTNPEPMEAP